MEQTLWQQKANTMTSPVQVRKVENKADHKAFFGFPWSVYKNDPNWVPPLLSIRRDLLDKKKNPAWEYMEGDYYAAWRGDQIVGTIAAFVNHRHNAFHGEHIAWFGFFEVYDDPEAASALLQTAAAWARERGYDAVRGPQSFTTHEECGLLVNGFTRPVMLMPYNPPYYQSLVEGAGFHKVMDTYSFYYNWTMSNEAKTEDRIARVVKRLMRGGNIQVRPINRKHMKADFELFKDIYNNAWEKNWGFTPMTAKELDALVDSLGTFFDPALSCFAVVDGEPAGFMLGIPDFNQVLQRANPRPGTPEIFTLLRALWHWKIRPCMDWMRIPLMGIKEPYRKKGLDLLMYSYFYEVVGKSRYQHMDSGWILESNRDMIGLAESVGMEAYKTYRFYQQDLK